MISQSTRTERIQVSEVWSALNNKNMTKTIRLYNTFSFHSWHQSRTRCILHKSRFHFLVSISTMSTVLAARTNLAHGNCWMLGEVGPGKVPAYAKSNYSAVNLKKKNLPESNFPIPWGNVLSIVLPDSLSTIVTDSSLGPKIKTFSTLKRFIISFLTHSLIINTNNLIMTIYLQNRQCCILTSFHFV